MIWSVLYWVLLSIAVLFLLRGLLWDRAGFRGRPKRRCRKCWYDLTGVDGNVSKEPVVCPECGKAHKTKRSMRRTRRGKKWVVGGIVIFIVAYSLRVTPTVRERGWWATVPSWVLVMGIHQTPTYVKNPDVEWGSVAYGNKSTLERAMRELHVRSRVDGLSWLDYQLIAWLARTEGVDGLCAWTRNRSFGVHPRASSYRILIENGISRGKLGAYHTRWFQRLVDVRVETREAWPEGYRVFGKPKIVDAKERYMKDPQLRVRMYDPMNNTSVFSPNGRYQPRRLQELDGRAMRFSERMGGMPARISMGAWDDGVIELRPRDPSDDFADLQVTVSEYLGESSSLVEPETIVDRFEISVPVRRVEGIESIATVVADQSIVEEIERCVQVEGYWWYDIDGCRRVVLTLRLHENPSLVRRRYTFGDDIVSAYSGGDILQGHGWWALEPDGDLGWRLVHGGRLVLMSGGGSEETLGSDYPWTVSIRSDPEYGLRDFDATYLVDARLQFEVSWTRLPQGGM